MRDALEVFGDRQAAIANDLTKMFEKVERGPLSALLTSVTQSKLRGEYVIVIAGAGKEIGESEAEEERR